MGKLEKYVPKKVEKCVPKKLETCKCGISIQHKNRQRHLKSKVHNNIMKNQLVESDSESSNETSSEDHYEELEDYEQGKRVHIDELERAIIKLRDQELLVHQLKYIVEHW